MSIQGKIGSLVAALFLMLIIFSAGILYSIVIPEFENLDRENTIHRAQQIQNTLHDELEDLVVYSSDWGIWDDTYAYMESRDPEFIASSAPDDTFEITNIHLMAFFNMDKELVWGRWLDKKTESYSDLNISFVDEKTGSLMSPEAIVTQGSLSGFVQTSRGPMLIAAYPILKSNQDGPARGFALTGRYMDEDRMGKIAEDLNASFDTIVDGRIVGKQSAIIPNEVIIDTLPENGIGLYNAPDEDMMYSYIDIIAMNGVTLMRLVHPHPMAILEKGQFAITTALQLFVAFFAIALLFIVMSLHRIVVTPLSTLRNKITSLASRDTLPAEKISQIQSNELLLALESFDIMEEEIRHHQSELEDKVRDRTHWLQETNDRLEKEVEERQRTEQNLLAAKVEAEQASKSKSEFLATISHEIRTPMNGVVGMTNLLLESSLDDEQLDYTQSIRNSADHLLLLINDILDISKLESGMSRLEISSFNLPDLLSSVTGVQQPKAHSKGLELKTEIDPELPEWVRSDPTRLRQILFNLIGNAIKFTDQGHIKISVTPFMPREGTTQWIKCTVEDTGIGISAEDQARIFERFTQADGSASRKHGGVGLGLSIAKRLSKQMDGEIGLESTPENGSLFWFTIPLEVAKSAPAPDQAIGSSEKNTTEKPTVPEKSENPLQILVVEDNKINQMLLLKFLTKRGHNVDITVNGIEALKYLETSSPDIILMDIQMPEMDGIEATKVIRTMEGDLATVPIIAVTANAMKGDRDTYITAGMNDYVAKPVDFKRLTEVINLYAPNRSSEAKKKVSKT
ncbi:ATP-binding protein [Kiloniella antarctica]|uniref:histidine kinase n=1 Tax=Kiloniella antarctica TaxID=1550907 RepID=A0ABW5BID0_9PROT